MPNQWTSNRINIFLILRQKDAIFKLSLFLRKSFLLNWADFALPHMTIGFCTFAHYF